MIVRDFHILCTSFSPPETDAMLVIYPDAILAFPVAFESFKSVARRNAQVVQVHGNLQLTQLAPSDFLKGNKSPDPDSACQKLSVFILKRINHLSIITLSVINVKRYYCNQAKTSGMPSVKGTCTLTRSREDTTWRPKEAQYRHIMDVSTVEFIGTI
jgi:hypothetical protein